MSPEAQRNVAVEREMLAVLREAVNEMASELRERKASSEQKPIEELLGEESVAKNIVLKLSEADKAVYERRKSGQNGERALSETLRALAEKMVDQNMDKTAVISALKIEMGKRLGYFQPPAAQDIEAAVERLGMPQKSTEHQNTPVAP